LRPSWRWYSPRGRVDHLITRRLKHRFYITNASDHCLVRKPVIDLFRDPSGFHQAGVAQGRELLAEGRLADLRRVIDFADRVLTVQKMRQNHEPLRLRVNFQLP
jgi:hypothetical protein